MRLLALLLLGLALLPAGAQQRPVTLLWNDNIETNVVGYRVYYGPAAGQYNQVMDVGDTTFAVVPVSGPTWFAVTAYDSDGLESGFSAEVSFVPPSGDTLFISDIQPVMLTNINGLATNVPCIGFRTTFLDVATGLKTVKVEYVREGGQAVIYEEAFRAVSVPSRIANVAAAPRKNITAAQLSPVRTSKRRVAPALPKSGKLPTP